MDNATYATITRQTGLQQEMQVLANNIANASTDGFQKEGIIFSEYVERMEQADTSLSMARAHARMVDRSQGQLTQTGGQFDFAIEGEGYFMLDTPEGNRLSRAGRFFPNAEGLLAAADGARVLDQGGAPIFVPPETQTLHVAPDGTISADGAPLGQIGLVMPADPNGMTRSGDVRFAIEGGTVPAEGATIAQGFIEASNVDPVLEVSRMIEVQRAYESGKALIDGEDDRMRTIIKTLGQ